MTEKRDKHAVILSGGAAHGAYEVGVMDALFSREIHDGAPVDPTIFTGTSVGSWNAAIMAGEVLRLKAKSEPSSALKANRVLRNHWLELAAEIPAVRDSRGILGRGKPNGVMRLRADLRDRSGVQRSATAGLLAALGLAIDETRFVAVDLLKRLANSLMSEGPWEGRVLELFDLSTVLSTSPLEQLIADTVNLRRLAPQPKPGQAVEEPPIKLCIVATDWDHGTTVAFTNDPTRPKGKQSEQSYEFRELTEHNGVPAILASAAIPGVFPAIQLDETNYVDGMVLMNTPLRPARDLGATVIHVINMEPRLELIPTGHLPSMLDTVGRMMNVAWSQAIRADIAQLKLKPDEKIEVHRYFPSRDLGGALSMLDFNQDRLVELMELGFEDAAGHDCYRCGCWPKTSKPRGAQ